jgi:hypothetical protein
VSGFRGAEKRRQTSSPIGIFLGATESLSNLAPRSGEPGITPRRPLMHLPLSGERSVATVTQNVTQKYGRCSPTLRVRQLLQRFLHVPVYWLTF